MAVCDLCGGVSGEGSVTFTADQLRRAVDHGLRPPNSVWEGSTAQMSGASKSEWESGWIQMVKQDNTSWTLCKSCADEANVALEKSK